jgi:hypothetical protein
LDDKKEEKDRPIKLPIYSSFEKEKKWVNSEN